MTKKKLQQELMIWLQSSIGVLQLSPIFRYDNHLYIYCFLSFLLWDYAVCLKHIVPILLNLQISDYEKEIEIMQNLTKEEHLASLRR